MKRVVAAAVMLAASVGAALAGGYDEFATGLAAAVRGDDDAAIAALTAALAAPDLVPAYKTTAYRVRARVLLKKKNCQQALADADMAVALAPSDRSVRRLHVAVNVCLKDYAGARRDYEAIKGLGTDEDIYWALGMLLWREGAFPDASANFLTSLEGMQKGDNSHASYIVLWYAMTEDRLGHLDRAKLAGYAASVKEEGWPGPLVDLFLGKIKPEQVQPAAHGARAAGQACEANFYIAEWQIARGNKDAAKPLIAEAVAKCPKGFVEYPGAKAEAGWLGLPEPAETKEEDQ